jgi:uncharacterized protein YbcV (DUF1398 family)
MDSRKLSVMQECVRDSFANRTTFPEEVKRLLAAAFERYEADLLQLHKTFYTASGEAGVESLPLTGGGAIADRFSAEDLKSALLAVQRREIDYPEFLRRSIAAGVANYVVFLSDGRTIYLGRHGDFHIEDFPKPV